MIILSCNRNEVKHKKTIAKTKIGYGLGEYELKFPDTVIVNATYIGDIFYNSILDTVKFSSKNKRYIFFYVTENKVHQNFNELKK